MITAKVAAVIARYRIRDLISFLRHRIRTIGRSKKIGKNFVEIDIPIASAEKSNLFRSNQ